VHRPWRVAALGGAAWEAKHGAGGAARRVGLVE
jgi:hypothetical protein